MTGPLRVGYLNVRGLTDDKWRHLVSLISPSSSTFDILFLSETWFVNHVSRISHPYTYLASPLLKVNTSGHQHGGLLLLVSPLVRTRIQTHAVSEHMISMALKPCMGHPAMTISALYLAPSLADPQIETILNKIPISDIILGDINTRYGALLHDKASGPAGRRHVIDGFAARRHLAHLIPHTGKTRVDHVFVRSELARPGTTLDISVAPVTTDHPLMTLCFPTSDTSLQEDILPEQHLGRYYTKYLSHPVTRKSLLSAYDDILPDLSGLMEEALQSALFSHDISDARALVNQIDQLLFLAVAETCQQVLGSYVVSETQGRLEDHLVDHLSREQPSSASSAIRLFKRSQRSSRSEHLLRSRHPDRSAMEDATDYYRDIYSLKTESRVECAPISPVSPLVSLAHLFAPPQTHHAIWKYPLNKSPGLDSIDIAILRALCPSSSSSFLRHLSGLFQLCMAYGVTPDRWNESVIFPIPKSTSNQSFIHERRPISLTVLFRRIFEKALLSGITHLEDLSRLRSFDRGQAGFRRGFSTLTQSLISHESSQLGLHVKIFLDLKQAYDRVQVPRLLSKLASRGASSQLLAIIHSLFSSCSSSVVVNGRLSSSFPRERGLFQGSLLSPWLFNVFIDDLATKMNQDVPLGHPPRLLLFADDIQLQSVAYEQGQRMLNSASQWLASNGMEVNIQKCAIVSSLPGRPPLSVSGQPIPYLDSYTYLGFPQTPSGIDWLRHIKKSMDKTKACIGYLRSSNHARSWPTWARLLVYKTFIRPLLEYGAPMICHWLMTPKKRRKKRPRISPSTSTSTSTSTWKELEAVQDQALFWIFGTTRPRPVLLSISSLGTMQHRFQELACRFTFHLDRLDPSNPATSLIGHVSSLSESSLLRRCKSHPLRVSYDQLKAFQPTASLRSFLVSHRLASLSTKSRLVKYILPSCRTGQSQIDSLLFLTSSSLFKKAFYWRRNVLGLGYTCLACSLPFNRCHIHRCSLLPPIVPLSSSEPNYTVLDELLNTRRYNEFLSSWLIVSSQLGH
jgi:endonuclease/exonuclease/phosphatase family metal-dependent hydrolase